MEVNTSQLFKSRYIDLTKPFNHESKKIYHRYCENPSISNTYTYEKILKTSILKHSLKASFFWSFVWNLLKYLLSQNNDVIGLDILLVNIFQNATIFFIVVLILHPLIYFWVKSDECTLEQNMKKVQEKCDDIALQVAIMAIIRIVGGLLQG